MTDRRRIDSLLGNIDWRSVAIYMALIVMGWLNIYASLYDDTQTFAFDLHQRYVMQLLWIGVSLAVALVILLLDDKYYHILAYPIYAVCLLVMAATLTPLGKEINGAKAWLVFGPIALQPTEFMKFATSLALARYMSHYSFSIHRFSDLLRIGAMMALPVGIMALQPDMGSAVVYGAFFFMMYREGLNKWIYIVMGLVIALFLSSFWLSPVSLTLIMLLACTLGVAIQSGQIADKVRYLAAVLLGSMILYYVCRLAQLSLSYHYALLISIAVSLFWVAAYALKGRMKICLIYVAIFFGSLAFASASDYVFDHLALHQQKRVLDLLGIESDLQRWGYNVNQSKIAIGSGGFMGKGFLKGTQTKFDFVPEQTTDFILCTVGEEWGFVGSLTVLTLFCLLVLRLVKMGERQGEPFRRIYCYCVAGIFFLHTFINVGMTIGLMPVIGIPLPFFSYGGSSFLAFTIMFFVAVRLDTGSSQISSMRM